MQAFKDAFDEESVGKDSSSVIVEELKKSIQEIDNEANIALEMLEKTDFETILKSDEEESKSSDEKKD